jgi:predicted dehydrogenase
MKCFNVGIVGLGFGQEVHIPVFSNRLDCQITAIAGTRGDKAAEVANRLGIPRSYCGWRKLLDEEPVDILSVATPPEIQFEIAKEALTRRIALFCEKPLALTVQQSEELVGLAGRSPIPAMVDFEFPEIPAWQACREELRTIGDIQGIHVRWTRQIYLNKTRRTSWKTRTAAGGGALYSFVSHVFYYLEWLVGPIVATSCRLSRAPGDDRRDSDSIASLELQLQSGVVAKVFVNTDQPNSTEHTVEIKGSEATLRLQNTTDGYIDGFALEVQEPQSFGLSKRVTFPEMGGRLGAVSRLADRLVTWCGSGTPSVPDLHSGHRVQCLIDASLASHRRDGAWTSLA